MQRITTFPGYIIEITEKKDGDMRENEHLGNLIRPYPQVHGTNIIEYTGANQNELTNIDGVYTTISGVRIGCICADCPVVLFLGKGEIAALHSGWRGTKMHIIASALPFFKHTELDDVIVYIGPHIRSQSYEVQEDFFENFPASYFEERGGKYYFDITRFLIDDLVRLGIQRGNISIHPDDTYSQEEYFSYRRDGMIGVGSVSVILLP